MAKQPTGINQKNLGAATQAVGGTNQAQVASDVLAGLQMFTNPGAALGQQLQLQATQGLQATQKELKPYLTAKPRTDKKTGEVFYMIGKQRVSAEDFNTRKGNLEADVTRFKTDLNRVRTYDPVAEFRGALGEQFGMRDSLLGRLSGALNPTSEYNRMQEALGRGLQAQQADMERVQAQQTDESTLGRSLREEAQRKMALGGQLSPEAMREATQSARQGFAARGMATGNAAMGAELLNRDRFARAREFDNLGFARSVEADDLARRTGNTQLRQQAGVQNADAFNRLSQFNTLQRDATNRLNVGMLGQSAMMADDERLRQIGVGQDQFNFAMSTDPRTMMMNLGQPFSRLTGATEGGLNVASFNQNVQGANYNTLMNNDASRYAAGVMAGATRDAATANSIGLRNAANAAKPQWWETGLGAVKSLFG